MKGLGGRGGRRRLRRHQLRFWGGKLPKRDAEGWKSWMRVRHVEESL
jgi:hypothetical protein